MSVSGVQKPNPVGFFIFIVGFFGRALLDAVKINIEQENNHLESYCLCKDNNELVSVLTATS